MRRWLFLILLLALSQPACLKRELQTGLREDEAQQIIVLLKGYGLSASKEMVMQDQKTSWTVYVHGGRQNLYLAWRILEENGLPRPAAPGLAEVFREGSLIPTASEEKARLLVGLAGELRSTLMALPGVIDARVHLVLPENSPLLEASQQSAATASVLIKYSGASTPLTSQEVQQLVGHGVEGLSPEQVAVVFKQVKITPLDPSELAWSLGDEELTLLALVLMLAGVGAALWFAAQNRRKAVRLQMLERQLGAGTRQQAQLSARKQEETPAA